MKKIVTLVTAAAITAAMSMTSLAAGWQQDSVGWWYGTNVDNTSWHTNGWQWIDGNGDNIAECYCFDVNGYMYANTTTPDGYTVNADGAWTVDGVVRTQVVTATPDRGGSGSGGGSESSSGSSAGTSVNADADIDRDSEDYADGDLQRFNGTYRLTARVEDGHEWSEEGLEYYDATVDIVILANGDLQFTFHNILGDSAPFVYPRSGIEEWTYTSGNLVEVYEFPDDNTMTCTNYIKGRALGEYIGIDTYTRE